MNPPDSIGNESNQGTKNKDKINYSLRSKTRKFKLRRPTLPKVKEKLTKKLPILKVFPVGCSCNLANPTNICTFNFQEI